MAGKYTFADGSFYAGAWLRGRMNGHGIPPLAPSSAPLFRRCVSKAQRRDADRRGDAVSARGRDIGDVSTPSRPQKLSLLASVSHTLSLVLNRQTDTLALLQTDRHVSFITDRQTR